MSTEPLISRVRNILLTPKTEWPVIAAEPDTTAGVYTRYIMILSAIPPLAGFVKGSLIGYGMFRVGILAGLGGAALHYVLGLASIYVVALIINMLAPTFGAQKDFVQALKSIAYASTASCIAGALVLLPWFGLLFTLAGFVYAIYLLYLGLPLTMRVPVEKAAGYTAVTMVCAIVLFGVVGYVAGDVTGARNMMRGASVSSTQFNTPSGSAKVDANSPLGQLGAVAQAMQANSQKLQEAQQSGDAAAQQKAAAQMLGSMFSGGEAVEALSPEQLKPFVPDTMNGLARKTYSVQRNAMMGVQTSQAQAGYRDDSGAHSVDLQIVDLGGAKGLAALAGWAGQSSESQSDTGYEKVYQDGSRMVHEQWNSQTHSGSLTMIIGGRFSVELSGTGFDMGELKTMAGSLNLSGLEALKQSGVKPG
jgi:Yip1-like protein